jgi:methylenetetrahydrofolate dehydrogenase (NADP+)/methenyltetrahydrofolate cyclohydrolase
MAKLLDGKAAAKAIRIRLKKQIRQYVADGHPQPHAVFVQVGENPASTQYVALKNLQATRIGCRSSIENLPGSASQQDLLDLLARLNADRGVHSILVQLPLPAYMSEQVIAEAIDPRKDVDCFHPENIGRVVLGLPAPRPATPLGVVNLLKANCIELTGRHAVVLGRSILVGRPLGILLLAENCTVSYCHSRTVDIGAITRQADILVSAVGRAGLVTGKMVQDGVVAVDVGTNFIPVLDGKGEPVLDADGNAQLQLVGDLVFDEVAARASWISPVPGGVGPMTIASVLENTLDLYRRIEGV